MNTHTWNEITGQDKALRKTIELMDNFVIPKLTNDEIHVFTGCGTSFYLAHSAAKYFQKITGKTAVAVPASEIFMDRDTVFSSKDYYVLVAISRSGTTSEVIKALKHVKDDSNIKTLAVTCNKDSRMTEYADNAIELDFIKEKSVVMTQSFSCMFLALQLYAVSIAAVHEKKKTLSKIVDLSTQIMHERDKVKVFAEEKRYQRYIFLGAGILNGLAKEATLKLKEMTQTECESYSNLEFRHGPISIVDQKTAVVVLSSDSSEEYDRSLVSDIQSKGGTVLVFAKENSQVAGNVTISIPAMEATDELAVVYMPLLQLLAYFRALALGLNPDQPRNLTQVVQVTL